ncbi:MAG TPA: DUF5681 domain-containing protein [Rhizomicrobium sp.]|nr:DUF5681 domain-containing protein [Rhizomicrobium sp.]
MTDTVGYCNPPVETRFRKGQSGNPGGRPGPRRALERRFEAALGEALLASPEALVSREPGSAFAGLAEGLVCGAVLDDPQALALVLGLMPGRGRRGRFPAQLVRAMQDAMAADEVGAPAPGNSHSA